LARNDRVREALVARMGGAALRSNDTLLALEPCWIVVRESRVDRSRLGNARPQLTSIAAPKFSALARRSLPGAVTAAPSRHTICACGSKHLAQCFVRGPDRDRARRSRGILRIARERIETGNLFVGYGHGLVDGSELATSIDMLLDIQLSALALNGGLTIESVVERIVRLVRRATIPPWLNLATGRFRRTCSRYPHSISPV